jgi:hypothetical protein
MQWLSQPPDIASRAYELACWLFLETGRFPMPTWNCHKLADGSK